MGLRCIEWRVSRTPDDVMSDSVWGMPAVCLLTLILCSPSSGNCEEFRFFKLTGIRGEMNLDYTFKRTEQEDADGVVSNEKRPAWQQELNLDTYSYFFHPNLLQMELGAGVRFKQDELETGYSTTQSKDRVYNFHGRWDLLKYKPYPISVHYSLSHPETSSGFADSMTVETESYGMSLYLRPPVVSTQMRMNAEHTQHQGESSSSIVDDQTDSFLYSVRFDIGDSGSGDLALSTSSNTSASGSKDLPIQESSSDTDSLDWSSRMKFGKKDNIDLSNYLYLSRNEESLTQDRDYLSFNNHVRWEYDESLTLSNDVKYSATQYETSESDNVGIGLGAAKRIGQAWHVSSHASANKGTATDFDESIQGLKGDIGYRDKINERWTMSANYSAGLRYVSQVSQRDTIQVLDEAHVLTGLAAVALSNEYVMAGTVTVSNLTHSQTYVENIDYRLTLIGAVTRIERLASGNITDGETVLLDYEYDSGGTYDYRDFTQSANLLFSLDGYYNISMGYSQGRPTLTSGIPTIELQPYDSYFLDANARVPINRISEYGWGLRFEQLDEERSPFTRAELNLSYSTLLPFFSASARLGSEYEATDHELSPNDVKELRFLASVYMRPSRRSVASLEFTTRRDNGGEELKQLSDLVLNYNWQRGRLAFEMSGRYLEEQQGTTTRTSTEFNATLTRKFR